MGVKGMVPMSCQLDHPPQKKKKQKQNHCGIANDSDSVHMVLQMTSAGRTSAPGNLRIFMQKTLESVLVPNPGMGPLRRLKACHEPLLLRKLISCLLMEALSVGRVPPL